MRRALTLVGLIAFLALAVSTGSAQAAAPKCRTVDTWTGLCVIKVVAPGSEPTTEPVADDGPQDTGTSSPCFFDPSRDGYTNVPAGPVPCTSDLGSWSNTLQCYTRRADPQPDAGDPVWAGHSPEEGGAIYGCYQPLPIDVDVYLWLLNPPVPAAAGPTPRAVAEMAVEQMDLEAIEIGIVPEPRPGFVGIVGQPVWMWAANPSASTVGPITRSASAGGITVTATATIHRIVWSMGDGAIVTCSGGGTPFTDDRAGTPSPDCGYVYNTSSADQPGERFTVTASSDWVIEWAGAGQTGTIRVNDLERSVRIAVGEAQVLVTS